jgi:hypothetical protein
VVVAADGAVWFSDPTFGILGDYEGYRAEPELPTYLYRLGPDGRLDAAAELRSPNGLAFSPDESVLYVVESRAVPHRRIVAYDVRDGSLGEQRTFIDCGDGIPDGLRIDEDGNLWCGWGGGEGLDGVRVFAPDATPIGHIDLPERCANLAFGGRARNRLFLAAHPSVRSLRQRPRRQLATRSAGRCSGRLKVETRDARVRGVAGIGRIQAYNHLLGIVHRGNRYSERFVLDAVLDEKPVVGEAAGDIGQVDVDDRRRSFRTVARRSDFVNLTGYPGHARLPF